MAAHVDWSWKSGPQKARAKLTGAARVQGSPRSTVPHVESKTERAETGGWGSGPGNNVSMVANGINAAQLKMATHMDENFGHVLKAKRRQRRANRHKAGHKTPTLVQHGPRPADKPTQSVGVRLEAGVCDVALKGWQIHSLNRLKTRR